MTLLSPDEAKRAARAVRASLAANGIELTHSQALETVAHAAGYGDWNTLSADLRRPGPREAIPVLRIFEPDLARRFYCDYLGFAIEFEHRFAAGMPLYLRVRRGPVALDLSEHYGDGTPGSVVWIAAVGLSQWHAELRTRDHLAALRPGIETDQPGGPTMTITDPFQNVLRVCEPD